MKKRIVAALLLLASLLLSGCAMRTVEEMYALPRRSEEYSQLQSAIDAAMANLTYSAPISGDNQQTVQTADLNGDGMDEYLVFAMGSSERPLQVLIFTQDENGICSLAEVISSNGTAFEQVEYVNFDEKPGLELVVGRQVSNQVLRNVSVYSFASGSAEQLFTIGYSRYITCDLDLNGRSEVMVLRPGESEAEQGMAVLYSYQGGKTVRSVETELSQDPSHIRRIQQGKLYGGKPAIYVASAVDDNAIVTDIFTMRGKHFENISYSGEAHTSVQTLCNFYVYAEDIDGDGVLELPNAIPMEAMSPWREGDQTSLLRWFSMDPEGNEVDKLYTFHDFLGGWYMQLGQQWAERVTVEQWGDSFTFYVWDEDYITAAEIFNIYILTGSSRDEDAQSNGRFPLYRAEGVAYAARLGGDAPMYGITKEYLNTSFRLIRQDWRTGES